MSEEKIEHREKAVSFARRLRELFEEANAEGVVLNMMQADPDQELLPLPDGCTKVMYALPSIFTSGINPHLSRPIAFTAEAVVKAGHVDGKIEIVKANV